MYRTHVSGGWYEEDWSLQTAHHTKMNRDGVVFSDTSNSAMLLSVRKWKHDAVRPGIVRIGNGTWKRPGSYERWSHDFTYTSTDEKIGPMWWWGDETWSDSGVDNGGYNPNDWSFPGTGFDSDLQDHAIIDVLNRLNSRQAEIGIAIGEAKETAELLSSLAINFYRNLIAAKKGHFQKASALRLIRQGNQQMLKWKFGWLPLGQTLYDLMSLLKEGIHARPLIISAKRRISTNRSGSWDLNSKPGNYTMADSVECGAYATLRSDFMANLNSIGMANPAEVLWELVPLSFVWDWFMPVGSFLQSLSATAGLDFLGGYTTRRNRGTYNGSLLVCGKAKVEYKHMNRTAWSTWPVTGSYLPYARPNPLNLDQGKLATLGQLIAQRNV